MKIAISILVLLVPMFSFAATKSYKIATKFFVDGKLVSAGQMITLPGKAAELSEQSDDAENTLKIKVVARDSSNKTTKDGILMKFEVEYQKGPRTIKSSPEILTQSGSEASVSVGGKEIKEDFQLKVIAIRQ